MIQAGTSLQETEHLLSPPQRRLWFLEQLFPGIPTYRTITGIRFRGALDVDALRSALAAIVTRHPVLRARFCERDGVPAQVISPPGPVLLDLTDLGRLGPDAAEAEVRRLAREEVRGPLDLRRGPMLRGRLVRLAPDHQVLLLTVHHIVFDAWSREVLLREMAALYRGLRRPGSAAAGLPPLPVEYVAYVVRQQGEAARARLERSRSYWREQLRGCVFPSSPLPTDGPLPAPPTLEGARASVGIPAELDARISELAKQQGTSVARVLLSAFQILLHRHAGNDELVVGLLVAGRREPEIRSLIGLFVNELPLPLHVERGDTFRTLLGRAHAAVLGALDHQDMPLEELVREISPAGLPGHSPLFQVAFNNKPPRQVALDFGEGLGASAITLDNGVAPFDLTLNVESEGEARTCHFDYPSGLFDPARMERMAGHFLTLLRGIVEGPDCPVATLPLLDERERRAILQAASGPVPASPAPDVVDAFLAQSRRRPAHPAVVGSDATLSYAELDGRSNQLARRLRSLGVGRESRVAVAVPRGAGELVALLATLKAGGAYVPVDPSHPMERVRVILEDAAPEVLIAPARSPLFTAVPPSTGLLPLDDLHGATAGFDAAPLEGSAGGDPLAYVLFTSGSTGRPKGVEVRRRALSNLLRSMATTPGATEDERLLAVTTTTFDIAHLELFLPLVVGGTVVIADRETVVDPRRLRRRLESGSFTIMQATPTTWRLLVEAGWTGSPGLRVFVGGEALNPELASALLDRSAEVWNLYGPTETTIWSTVERIRRGAGRISIGRPIDGTRIYIVDEAPQLAPMGVIGEIAIGGEGLARGYRGRPELTAERFVPDPHGEAGERLYRTGDLGRLLPDGRFECLGRTDHQVKIRGFRVELGEIECVLRSVPGVHEAVVVADRPATGDARLVAYWVGSAGRQELFERTRASLPAFMVPSAFVLLESFPLTTSGKIDRRSLAARPAAPVAPASLPRTLKAGERRLSVIWQELLGRMAFAPTDDFFDVGGHSLLAVRLVAEIEKAFGIRIPLSTLVKSSTLERVSAEIEAGRPGVPSRVVRFNEGGERPPLFAITPFLGDALMFRQLSAALGPAQPVFSLQPIGLIGTRCQESVETAAAELVGAIEAAQPSGPCHVLGYCVGGQIALEVACQLESRGRTVAFLGLLDALRPGTRKAAEAQARREARQAGGVSSGGLSSPRKRSSPILHGVGRRLRTGFLRLTFDLCRHANVRQPGFLQGEELLETVVVSRHRLRPFPGSAVLFLSTDERGGVLPRDRGWGGLVAGGLRVVDVPGDHVAILHRPGVLGLGERITRAIEESRSNVSGTGGSTDVPQTRKQPARSPPPDLTEPSTAGPGPSETRVEVGAPPPLTRLRRLLRKLTTAAARARSSRLAVLRCVLSVWRRTGVRPGEALLLGLGDPAVPAEVVSACLGKRALLALQEALNAPEAIALTEDKSLFYARCQALGLPVPRTYAVIQAEGGWIPTGAAPADDGEWARYLGEALPATFVTKPSLGVYGEAVGVWTRRRDGFEDHRGRTCSAAALRGTLLSHAVYRQFIVQERLSNHPELVRLTASPFLQTVRVSTLLEPDGRSRILYAECKIIAGDRVTDNFCGGAVGNLVANVAPETGLLANAHRPSPDGVGPESVPRHPATGVAFEGFALPDWPALIELAHRCAEAFPALRTVGWDLALTPVGPMVVEGNAWWDPPNDALLAPAAPGVARHGMIGAVALLRREAASRRVAEPPSPR